jgi:hypothetical protein
MASLHFSIQDKNCRVFSAAVSTLSRIGTDITMEWRESEISLRTLTDTQAAFAGVHFQEPFFEALSNPSEVARETAAGAGGGGGIAPGRPLPQQKTKFNARVLAWAFRGMKGVTRLRAYFAAQGARNLFVVRCELASGMVRTHALHYEEAAILQPFFRREASPFQLCARPALFKAVLESIHADELSVLASPTVVQFQSYHDAAAAGATVRGPLHTAMAFDSSEFDGVHLDHTLAAERGGGPPPAAGELPLVAVTFVKKELAHMLSFAMSPPVQSDEFAVFFDAPGAPVLFSTHGLKPRPFRAELILATVENTVIAPAPSSVLFAAMAAAAAEAAAAVGGGGGGGAVAAAARAPAEEGGAEGGGAGTAGDGSAGGREGDLVSVGGLGGGVFFAGGDGGGAVSWEKW